MNYLEDTYNCVLTGDPLIHIIENLCEKSLYNLKLVSKFYYNNEKVLTAINLKQSLKGSLIITIFGRDNLIKNRGSSIPDNYILYSIPDNYLLYSKILGQIPYETFTDIRVVIDIDIKNLTKMLTYMHIYFNGSDKHLIEVGTYHSWFDGPGQSYFKLCFNDQIITVEVNKTNEKEQMNKLRDVFMELEKINIINTFKKYYT